MTKITSTIILFMTLLSHTPAKAEMVYADIQYTNTNEKTLEAKRAALIFKERIWDRKSIHYLGYTNLFAKNRTIEIAILHDTEYCDNPANSRYETRMYSKCPAIIIESSKSNQNRILSQICLINVLKEDNPQKNKTYAEYDDQKNSLIIKTVQNGEIQNACTQTIRF